MHVFWRFFILFLALGVLVFAFMATTQEERAASDGAPVRAPAEAQTEWIAEAVASYHVPAAFGLAWEHMTSLGACDHFLLVLPASTTNAAVSFSWSLVGPGGAGNFALVVSTTSGTEYLRAASPGLIEAQLAPGETILAPWPDGPVVNQDAEIRVRASGEGAEPEPVVLEARLFDGSPCA